MNKHLSVIGLLIVGLVTFCGCTDPPVGTAKPTATHTAVVFNGTPAEHNALVRACVRDAGFTTVDSPDDETGFAVDTTGHTSKQVFDNLQKCEEKVGAPKMAALSAAELQARYDARTAQWKCLIAKSLAHGSPPSYDVFVDEYQRSGQKTLWEPTTGAATTDGTGHPVSPSTTCPRATSW